MRWNEILMLIRRFSYLKKYILSLPIQNKDLSIKKFKIRTKLRHQNLKTEKTLYQNFTDIILTNFFDLKLFCWSDEYADQDFVQRNHAEYGNFCAVLIYEYYQISFFPE